MDQTTVEQARTAADRAADDAGIEIADLHEVADLHDLSALFDRVWGRGEGAAGRAMPVEVMVATAHAGAQISGAYRGNQLVGGTATLLGRDGTGMYLHSHITGVAGDAQGTGVGWALKQHQRAWALQHQIRDIRWTFDPLVRRNAVFNVVKLGARPTAYRENLYGEMEDERNRGLPTDRLVTRWDLTAGRVVAAARGEFHEPRIEALRSVGAEQILVDDDGEPRTAAVTGERLLAQIPPDIEEIRERDLARAARWAVAVRETLGAALQSGYRIGGVTRDGWYVLAADPTVTELART